MSSDLKNPRQLHDATSQIRTSYTKKPRVGISFPGPDRTKQSFKDECDVNRIMARYLATGQLPNMAEIEPQYLDVTGLDYQEHQNFIAGANSLFHELPSKIRARFSNSPGEFLDFCSQEKNRPEMAEMGLLRPIVAAPIPAPTMATPAAPAASPEPAAPAAPAQ
jgi:phage internal scaffolding protein